MSRIETIAMLAGVLGNGLDTLAELALDQRVTLRAEPVDPAEKSPERHSKSGRCNTG